LKNHSSNESSSNLSAGGLLPGLDLHAAHQDAHPSHEQIGDGAVLLRGFAGGEAPALLAAVATVTAAAPFRRMTTPRGPMLVAMTNAGRAGWVTDHGGYRYDGVDPETGRPWPEMPDIFRDLAQRAAAAGGFAGFEPDACLINRYEPGAQMGLHQDRDERDFGQPIVSVSLGLPGRFLFGGLRRGDKPPRILLQSGDVVVWGGRARLIFHGVAPLADGEHPLTGRARINLTFRKAL
jgi:alkylated DNA repair protein (DNA oxidative demethylase)